MPTVPIVLPVETVIAKMDERTRELLIGYADQYETQDFLNGDPSWFMHQVVGVPDQEVMALLASCLSYGSRSQFFPKIQFMLDKSHGKVYDWVRQGAYKEAIPDTDACYYRLYTCHQVRCLLAALQAMLTEYGTIGTYVRQVIARREPSVTDVMATLWALSDYFQSRGIKGMVPRPVYSLCKRPCMFLRWMVRDGSPVDLGLWSDFIDKRNLLIPMDTHVQQMAQQLHLIHQRTATWASVIALTEELRQVFPDDPAKGDFALFGAGVG